MWRKKIKEAVTQLNDEFHVLVDLRKCVLLPPECKPIIEDVESFCKANGMQRSVLILATDIAVMQTKIVAKKTGIYEWERYINASTNPDWEEIAMNWLIKEIDPYKITNPSVSNP